MASIFKDFLVRAVPSLEAVRSELLLRLDWVTIIDNKPNKEPLCEEGGKLPILATHKEVLQTEVNQHRMVEDSIVRDHKMELYMYSNYSEVSKVNYHSVTKNRS